VTRDIVTLRIDPGPTAIVSGHALQLTLYALTAAGRTDLIPAGMAVWSSSDPTIAEVNRQGRLTPRRAGEVTVKAVYGGHTGEVALVVRD
jgi:hypothetical protein